jgi:hypothetical protein
MPDPVETSLPGEPMKSEQTAAMLRLDHSLPFGGRFHGDGQ